MSTTTEGVFLSEVMATRALIVGHQERDTKTMKEKAASNPASLIARGRERRTSPLGILEKEVPL